MTLAPIAERCDGAVNGPLVFAVAASGANSEDVRSNLEWKPRARVGDLAGEQRPEHGGNL
jgi:hypothetical protein